jgi:hypothetical protein
MFLDFLNANPTLYDSVFACLSPATIARYSRTSRGCREAVISFQRRAYNINHHLSHFFDNPLEFRAIQARTGTLISGSNALQFLDRTFYDDADLDLYVDDINREEVGLYLIRNGYCYKPRGKQAVPFSGPDRPRYEVTGLIPASTGETPYYGIQGVAGVFDFIKEGSPRLKIQLVTAIYSPLEIILTFHSSACPIPFFYCRLPRDIDNLYSLRNEFYQL